MNDQGIMICGKCKGTGVEKIYLPYMDLLEGKYNEYIEDGSIELIIPAPSDQKTCTICKGRGKIDWLENIIGGYGIKEDE